MEYRQYPYELKKLVLKRKLVLFGTYLGGILITTVSALAIVKLPRVQWLVSRYPALCITLVGLLFARGVLMLNVQEGSLERGFSMLNVYVSSAVYFSLRPEEVLSEAVVSTLKILTAATLSVIIFRRNSIYRPFIEIVGSAGLIIGTFLLIASSPQLKTIRDWSLIFFFLFILIDDFYYGLFICEGPPYSNLKFASLLVRSLPLFVDSLMIFGRLAAMASRNIDN